MADVSYIIALRDRVSSTAKRMQMSLQGIENHAQAAGSVLTKLTLVTGVAAGAMFKYGSEIEKTQVAFNTLTGSAEKGKALFSELTEFANKTPFSNRDINKSAQTLLSFGQDASTVNDTLSMLSDIAMGDADSLKRVTLAFGQIQSTGRLMGQDLLQLINVGFNPLQEISKQTGLSMGVLREKMRKGQISADMVTKAFKSATSQGGAYNKMTEKMSKTMSGRFSTALGKGQFFLGELGLAMKGIFTPLLEGAIKAIDTLSKYKDEIARLLPSVGVFVAVVGGLSAAFVVLNAVMNANPIFLIITAVALLSAKIYHLATQVDNWGLQWEITTKSIELSLEQFADTFKLIFLRIQDVFQGTLNNMSSSWLRFKGMIGIISDEESKKARALIDLEDQARAKSLKKASDDLKKKQQMMYLLGQMNVLKWKGGGDETDPLAGLAGGANAALTPELDFGGELDKLKAEGVVSGNINTFNINIGELKGIENLNTTNIKEGSQNAAKSVTDAILNALADVKVN